MGGDLLNAVLGQGEVTATPLQVANAYAALVNGGTLFQPRVVLRPGSWTKPAGVSPVRVVAGEPGSRPRFVVERWRAERGVKSLFGGSKHAGRSATRRESCSLVRLTMGEPSRSCHGEGRCSTDWRSGYAHRRVLPGYGERHVCTVSLRNRRDPSVQPGQQRPLV